MNQNILNVFDISQSTGEITVKGLIDYEEKDTYEIEIEASDKGLAPLTTEKSVIIKIVDVNDNAPEIEVTSFSSSIPEDSRPGTTVALISVNDLDSGLNGKVICSLSEDVPFALSPSLKDKMYSLVTKSPLDREKQSQYDLTITARDAGQPPLSSEKTISVVVSDVNDNSPEFSLSPYTFYVTEANEPDSGTPSLSSNVTVNVFILDQNDNAPVILYPVSSNGSAEAFDRDENDNALISYHILRDGSEENKLASFLNINSENGHISALKSFDFETLKTFQFQVVATDSGTPSLSSNVTVNVFILDQNDNAPVILYPVSSNGSAEGVEEIPLNVNAGHLVTKVRAYDADIGYNGWLLFSLQEVTDHSLFGLDRYTGQIRTLRSFTETDEAEHKLLILVKDNGNVSLSATATVIVKLVEPKEAFAASDVKSAAKVDEDDNVTFYLMITLGSVSVLFIISIIVLIAMQCSKSTDYTSKYLQETNYDGTLVSQHPVQIWRQTVHVSWTQNEYRIYYSPVPGSHANTLVLPDRRRASGELPQSDVNSRFGAYGCIWKYSICPDVCLCGKRMNVFTRGNIILELLSLSSNVTVNVFILDQNDNAPVILYPVSSNGSAEGVEEIPRNVNAGHLNDNAPVILYPVSSNGSAEGVEEIPLNVNAGHLVTKDRSEHFASFTETDEAEHKLLILVKDNGNVSLSATATVTVKLVEPKEAFAASDVKSAAKVDEDDNVTFYLMITLGSVSVLFIISIIVLIAMQCSKSTDYTSKYLQETNYDGTLCHSIQYRSGDKRYMLVGPRMSIGSTIVPGSHANTLVLPDRRRASGEIRYSISEEVKEGNIAKDLGIDKATLQDREYCIVSSSTEPLFRLNPEDGILYVSTKVDREEM
ncbi:hypothetical protein L3Q82_005755 [Scortum barcoo]|uniref:Uncharacterized protein n=1 Tax=Scortum barcoo TaxID=214431 RepID=A0ACB8V6W5_9TELE|nr:hypothetical protein L3Q82_005755 [Scortum barcoo]